MKQRIIDIVYEAKPDDVFDFSVILDFKQCNDILVKVKFLENYIISVSNVSCMICYRDN